VAQEAHQVEALVLVALLAELAELGLLAVLAHKMEELLIRAGWAAAVAGLLRLAIMA